MDWKQDWNYSSDTGVKCIKWKKKFLALKHFASDGLMKRLIATESVYWTETNISNMFNLIKYFLAFLRGEGIYSTK